MSASISGGPGSHSRELDAARGLAILLVVLLHYTPFYFKPEQVDQVLGFLSFVPRSGRTGVVLFFVLSAFLLTRPFWLERAGGAKPPLSSFFYRRVLRIIPLFYVAVLVAYLVVGDGRAALRALLFISDGKSLHPFSGIWWSLQTEAQFYVLLGASVYLCRKPRWRPFFLVALAVYVFGYLAFALGAFGSLGWGMSNVSGWTLRSLLGQWPAFAFGALASWLFVERGAAWRESVARSRWLGRGGGDGVMLLILLALGGALSSVASMHYIAVLREYGLWPVLEGVLWAVFIMALLLLPLRSRPLFVNRPLEFLGLVSYSLYLIHYPLHRYSAPLRLEARRAVFGSAERTVGIAAIEMGLMMALAICLSWMTYRCIEAPFLALKSRVGSAPTTSPEV